MGVSSGSDPSSSGSSCGVGAKDSSSGLSPSFSIGGEGGRGGKGGVKVGVGDSIVGSLLLFQVLL